MKLKSVFFTTCVLTLISILFMSHNTFSAAGPAVGTPELSEAEMQQLESQMEAEINQFVSSLPPEQQDQFYRDVEALTEAMSQMSEEELTKFVEDVFAEPTAPVAPPPTPVTPPKPVEKPKEPEVVKPVTPKKEVDAAVKLLDDTFDRINSFLHKANIIVDFPTKAERWGTRGKITGWDKKTMDWQKFKEGTVRLAQKLRTLISVDPKTKKHRFIDDFIKDKALYNNIKTLNTWLNTYEPKIEFAETGVEIWNLDPDSKIAAQATMSKLLEARIQMKVPEGIDAIVAKYKDIAGKIKQEEEAAVQKALEALRRPQMPPVVRVVGAPEDAAYAAAPYPTTEYGTGYEYGAPAYRPPSAAPTKPTTRKPTDTKKPDKKPDKKPAALTTAIPTETEKRMELHFENIETTIEEINDIIDEITSYKGLDAKLKSAPTQPPTAQPTPGQPTPTQPAPAQPTPLQQTTTDLIGKFGDLNKSIKKLATSIGSFNAAFQRLPAQARNRAEKQVKDLLKEPAEKIDSLAKRAQGATDENKTLYQLTKIEGSIKGLKKKISEIGKVKARPWQEKETAQTAPQTAF